MIYHNKDIHAKNMGCSISGTTKIFSFMLICMVAGSLHAGSYTGSDFASPSASSQVESGDSLILAPKDFEMAKLYGDSAPAVSIGHTRCPEVITVDTRRFSFFWADTNTQAPDYEDIYVREIGFYGPNITREDSTRIFWRAYYRTGNLHAAMGENNYLCVFVDHEMDTVRAANEHHEKMLYGVIGMRPFGSLCHFEGDTFLVVHRKGNQELSLKKVHSSSLEIDVKDSVTAASINNFLEAMLGSAVAVESGQKNILVIFTRQAGVGQKQLEYVLLDRSMSQLDSDVFSNDVGADSVYYYEDAPVIAYGDNKFAAASWDNDEISLHTFEWDGSTMSRQIKSVATGDSARFPALACNDSFLVVAWKGGLGSDNTSRIRGIRYMFTPGGDIAATAYDTILFSDPSSDVPLTDRYGSALNVAVDSTGAMAIAWPGVNNVWNCIWDELDILYSSGYWVSQSQTIGVDTDDSVRFYPGTISLNNTVNGRSEDSLRFAATAGAWNDWIALDDGSSLDANAGPWQYFQYKMTLYRNEDDSLRTPIGRQVDIPWNVKPKYISIDSVEAGAHVSNSVAFGSAITCYSRLDPLTFYFKSKDADDTDSAYYTVAIMNQTSDTVVGLHSDTGIGTAQFSPLSVSDTFVNAIFTLEDRRGWDAEPETLIVNPQNALPQVSVRAVWDSAQDGTIDTTDFTSGIMNFNVLEGDSIEFLYSVSDINDPSISVYLVLDNETVEFASAGLEGHYVLKGDSSSTYGFQDIRFRANDPDTTIERRAMVGVNHIPIITGATLDDVSLPDEDTIRILVGSSAEIDVTVDDSDVVYWDSIIYRFTTEAFDTSQKESRFVFSPSRQDSSLRIIVTDIFGQADTMKTHFKYPWFSSDSADNPALYAAKDTLRDDISLILGGGAKDTVYIPLRNTGNDTMSVTGLSFAGNSPGWLAIGVPQAESLLVFDSAAFSDSIDPVALGPGAADTFYAWFDPSGLTGDSLIYDTLILKTTDPVHPYDTFPIQLEYNDLPQLQEISFDFASSSPYWLAKKQSGPYNFPPHAKIALGFSEPIDTLSAAGAITVYSIFDSAATGGVTPITLQRSWNNDYTRLFCAAYYQQPSEHFSGMRPPPGTFLPTDSIALTIASDLTDRATTPSGPNSLDVDRDYLRDTSEDTTIAFKVDSITFRIISTSPAADARDIRPDSSITITFSGPLYPGTLDTSSTGNRSLIVTSRYSRGQQHDFSSVTIDGNSATFTLARTLYFGDSVHCWYRSVTGRDSLGYPLETDQDGIPVTFIDSSRTEDDFSWSYFVKEIEIASIEPDSGSRNADIHSPITLHFSNKIYPGTIDTDSLHNNRSFTAITRYSSGQPIGYSSIDIASDSMSITFLPESSFFSVDSIHCRFIGFSRDFSYDSSSNLPQAMGAIMGGMEWDFFTKKVGFYVYPNPYKSGKNSRHCGLPNAPCGIWFKNLHSWANSGSVRIVIMNMKGYPVFDTDKANIAITFREGDPDSKPQWKWDTRNQAGEDVASGLYFFAIYDAEGDALTKGKLMIVR
ncbi:MAG: hypothetical protein GF401_06495 [Chitinivibrionales bacterium]|nr:hypothetical protein [Chitinivibrionales bacterium]